MLMLCFRAFVPDQGITVTTENQPQSLADAFKLGMRQWASGVTVVSAIDAKGVPHAMTVSSLTSVSDAPPSLLVCINKNAKMAGFLKEGGRFVVNVLDAVSQELSNLCATPGSYDQRFNNSFWEVGDVARVKAALCAFDCKISKMVEHGSHYVVIGDLIAAHTRSDGGAPLCYWNGNYRELSL